MHTRWRCLTMLLCTGLLGAGADTGPLQATRSTTLADAWLAEHLDRDMARARSAFAEAAQRETTTDRRALALARRAEIDLVLGDESAVSSAITTLRPLLGRAPVGNTPFELPRSELRDALAMGDGPPREAALVRARELMRDRFEALDRDRVSVRGVVPWVARAAERGREQSELIRATGDSTRAAWRAHVLRLLAEERFDAAERLTARLRPDRGARTSSPDLDNLRRSQDLTAAEHEALESLEGTLDTWRQRGDETLVARALAALPY